MPRDPLTHYAICEALTISKYPVKKVLKFNPLTPNDPCGGRTEPSTSKR